MMDEARRAGLSPLICSSYRTRAKQEELHKNQVQKFLSEGYSQSMAEQKASQWVAPPGTSEHELGLAVDIVATDHQLLDETQEHTPEQKWLMENCWKYGFILRYPTSQSSITGICLLYTSINTSFGPTSCMEYSMTCTFCTCVIVTAFT